MQNAVALQTRGSRSLQQIVAEIAGVEEHEVHLDGGLVEQLGDDSLDLLQFLFEVEKVFRVHARELSLSSLESLLRDRPGVSIREFVARLIG
jgi:acyl carrier protein